MKTKFLALLLLCLPLVLGAQNYEQQGDELFAQAQYEKAVKKYKAAEAVAEMNGLVISQQLREKKDKTLKCIDLLGKANSAEDNQQYEEAENLYSELYALHPLPSYHSKAKKAAFHKAHANTIVNGHTAVDMGLSVKWADCNIGASGPGGVGDYFSWGEIRTKSSFSWSSYKFVSRGKLTKYCTNSSSGTVDNKLVLESQDDAAYINWGSSWRIPTKEQWEELADKGKCKWEWSTNNGVEGYKVTSKITGNSIFLPVSGYKNSQTNLNRTDLGLYWTSTLYPDFWNGRYVAAYRFDLGSTHYDCGRDNRSNGRQIRAVCK